MGGSTTAYLSWPTYLNSSRLVVIVAQIKAICQIRNSCSLSNDSIVVQVLKRHALLVSLPPHAMFTGYDHQSQAIDEDISHQYRVGLVDRGLL